GSLRRFRIGFQRSSSCSACRRMMPAQTSEILRGFALTSLYFVAILAFGATTLKLLTGADNEAIGARTSRVALLWIAFVIGQGVVSAMWLVLSLAGNFVGSLVWAFCAIGWLIAVVWMIRHRREAAPALRAVYGSCVDFLHSRSWYYSLLIWVLVIVIALAG